MVCARRRLRCRRHHGNPPLVPANDGASLRSSQFFQSSQLSCFKILPIESPAKNQIHNLSTHRARRVHLKFPIESVNHLGSAVHFLLRSSVVRTATAVEPGRHRREPGGSPAHRAAASRAVPKTRIILRAGSGFNREDLMAWCEKLGVAYLFGSARNKRLRSKIARELRQAKREQEGSGKPALVFKEFFYRTKTICSRSRSVAAAALLKTISACRFSASLKKERPRYQQKHARNR